MPELPEVELLVNHLNESLPESPLMNCHILKQRVIRYDKSLSRENWGASILGLKIGTIKRKGKYFCIPFKSPQKHAKCFSQLVGHLGMTGRIFWSDKKSQYLKDKHVVLLFDFNQSAMVFKDVRQFGFMSFETRALNKLGVDPLAETWGKYDWPEKTSISKRNVKSILMDQSIVCGLGNIYVNEILFNAKIHPQRKWSKLSSFEKIKIKDSITRVLTQAISIGQNVPLDFSGEKSVNRLFYFGGSDPEVKYQDMELLRVYDRCGKECRSCQGTIEKIVMENRSTFYCQNCQK